jgi:hypothetical protein
MTDSKVYRQEQPSWCPHSNCLHRRRVEDAVCGGELPAPTYHNGVANTHRLCMRNTDSGEVIDWMTNGNDLEQLRWVFDALDGKCTSWLSKAAREVADND